MESTSIWYPMKFFYIFFHHGGPGEELKGGPLQLGGGYLESGQIFNYIYIYIIYWTDS